MTTASKPSPHSLIADLWNGSENRRISLATRDLQRVLLWYGGTYLHLRAGIGCDLKHRRIGPGVYDVWLEPRP